MGTSRVEHGPGLLPPLRKESESRWGAAGERRRPGPDGEEGPAQAALSLRLPDGGKVSGGCRWVSPGPEVAYPKSGRRVSAVCAEFAGTSQGSRLPARRSYPLPALPLPGPDCPPLALMGFGTPGPDYLGTETLTLQKERPFHHGPVHGPRRFLLCFLALQTGGGAGAGRGRAEPWRGVPAPVPDPTDRGPGGKRGASRERGRVPR